MIIFFILAEHLNHDGLIVLEIGKEKVWEDLCCFCLVLSYSLGFSTSAIHYLPCLSSQFFVPPGLLPFLGTLGWYSCS